MNSIILKRFSGNCRLAGLAVMLFMFLCAQVTRGDVLVKYTYGSSVPGTSNAATVIANMTASACTNRSLFVWAQDSPTPAYASAPVLRVAPQNATGTEALAVANSCYFFFTLTASSNYTINATNLTFNGARGGGGTPRGYGVRSSVDNFATDLATADFATQRNSWTPVSVNLGSAFTNLATVTFRIYVYSTGNGATVEFDDMTVNGTINVLTGPPPPQPVTLALYNFGTNTVGTSNAALVGTNLSVSACTNVGLTTWELGNMTYGYSTQPPLRVTPAGGATSEALAVANNSYFFFTLAASNGFWINGSTLTFDVAKGGTGVRGYGVRSSVDNFATDLYTADCGTTRPTWENIVVNLGSVFQNLDTVTFRIYVYTPGTGSSIEFDDVTVNGTVAPKTVPPIITAQPTNNIIVVGGSSTFTVAAYSITNIFYQWYTNGVTTNLVADTSSAGTNASYTYANATLADNGRTFRVVLTNVFGASTSTVAVLTVLTPDVHILAAPVSQTNTEWSTVTFTVGALGAAPLSYQWFTNGVPMDGATNSTYTTPPLHPFPWNGLPVTVVVSNALSVATSAPPAFVTVIPETVPPHFTAAIARGAPTSAITVWFDEAVVPNPANYTIPGVTVLSAVHGENSNSVNLITTPLTTGNTYYLTVSGTLDQDAQTPNPSASVLTNLVYQGSFSPGFLLAENYANIGASQAIADLTNNANYLRYISNTVTYLPSAYFITAAGGYGAQVNYGVKVSGFFTPPVSGDYGFYLIHDDGGMFRLGPDANPVNIGQATNVIYQNNVQGGYADGVNAATNTLVGGQTYYFDLIMKQGGGGEYVGLAVRFPGDIRATASLPSFFGLPYVGSYADPNGVSLAIASQPQDVFTYQNQTATLSATVSLNPRGAVEYQWQMDDGTSHFTNLLSNGGISGAGYAYSTNTIVPGLATVSYTTPLLGAQTNRYQVLLSIVGSGVVTSQVATVWGLSDYNPPQLLSVAQDNTAIGTVPFMLQVAFSEPMDLSTTTNPANYRINGLAGSVTNALMIGTSGIELYTTGLPYGSNTLSVTAVFDTAGNVITDTNLSFRCYQAVTNGVVRREWFTNMVPAGNAAVTSLLAYATYVNNKPDVVDYPASLNYGGGGGLNYGQYWSGYLTPSVSGPYTFELFSDDEGRFLLSTDDNPANLQTVVRYNGFFRKVPVWK